MNIYTFKYVLQKGGIILKNNHYHTSNTKSQFIEILKSISWSDSQVKQFFSSFWKDMSNGTACSPIFMGMIFNNNTVDSFGTPDSLFRVLFEITEMHDELILFITEIIIQYDNEVLKDDSKVNIASMALAQLRWLSNLSEATHLNMVKKLLEILDVVQTSLKNDIIVFLPDIISCDSMSSLVGEKLNFVLLLCPDIANAIFDSLSRIQLDETLLSEIMDSALQLLDSDNFNCVGPILNFILRYCPSHLFRTILCQMRNHFSLEPRSFYRTSTPFLEPADLEVIICENLNCAFLFRQGIMEIWLQVVMSSCSNSNNNKGFMLDWLIFLTCFQSYSSMKKEVIPALKTHG